MLCGWGRRDNNNKTIIHNVVKVELFNYKPIPKLERLLLVSPLALSIWNEPLFMHEARVCIRCLWWEQATSQAGRQSASQPTSQLVRRRKICNPLCWHITKNTTRTTTNAYTNTHTYTYTNTHPGTHTRTHVHIYIETNREKSFESGLWLAGVAAKCQLMGMFVHRRLELNQIFVDMFCFSFCFSEQQQLQ